MSYQPRVERLEDRLTPAGFEGFEAPVLLSSLDPQLNAARLEYDSLFDSSAIPVPGPACGKISRSQAVSMANGMELGNSLCPDACYLKALGKHGPVSDADGDIVMFYHRDPPTPDQQPTVKEDIVDTGPSVQRPRLRRENIMLFEVAEPPRPKNELGGPADPNAQPAHGITQDLDNLGNPIPR